MRGRVLQTQRAAAMGKEKKSTRKYKAKHQAADVERRKRPEGPPSGKRPGSAKPPKRKRPAGGPAAKRGAAAPRRAAAAADDAEEREPAVAAPDLAAMDADEFMESGFMAALDKGQVDVEALPVQQPTS